MAKKQLAASISGERRHSWQFAAAVRTAVGCLGVMLLTALIVLPVTPQFRFADQLKPIGEGIFGREGPVDVLFVGTSRTMAAVVGRELERNLEERLGRPVVIYDLATSGRGTDVDYLVVKEVLERSPVRLVVAEYSATSLTSNHFYFTQAASWSDLFMNSWIFDDPFSRFAAAVRLKLSMFMTQMASDQRFVPPKVLATAETYDYSAPRGPNEARIREAMAMGRQPQQRLRLGEPRNLIQDTYVRKMIDIVRSQDGELVLMLMPGLVDQPLPVRERRRLSKFFGVDVIGLNKADLAAFTPHHYADERHHGKLAAALYMPLLADWIAPKLISHVAKQLSQ